MSTKHLFTSPRTPLEEVIAHACQAMAAQGYRFYSIKELALSWRRLALYAQRVGVDVLSPALVQAYTAECEQDQSISRYHLGLAGRAARRLLTFQQDGHWRRFPLRPQESVHLFDPPKTPLETVMAESYQAMTERGYLSTTLYEVSRICRHVVRFAEGRGVDALSPALVEDYLSACKDTAGVPRAHLMSARRVLRRLLEFQQSGNWRRFPVRREESAPNSPCLVAAREDFLENWKTERKVSRNTYQYGRRYTMQFLLFLEEREVRNWSQLSAPLIGEFVTGTPGWSASSRQVVASILRVFLRHLFVSGHADRDWSGCLPVFRRGARLKLPTIWTQEELAALLAAVERASAVGKRDYAILLLACKLGMRASDIRTLRLDDIHWDETRIEFVQEKTGARVVLPLPTDVGEALIEYLRDARPVTDHREVFLRHTAPHGPFADETKFHTMLNRYRQRAGIRRKPGQAYGMHSLRHTFATQLQRATVGLETIASLLGHQSLDSARIYTRVDIPALRQCALDPAEVEHAG